MPHSPFAWRFVRTQSGMKLPFASFQFRFVVSASPVTGLAGAVDVPESAFTMYFPTLPFTAVLPLPNTSHAAPNRGVTSFQFTESLAAVVKLRKGASVA